MDHFLYRDGHLMAEEVAIEKIAAEVGTPFYCYSAATLRRHYRVFADAVADLPGALVCYAVKANSNVAVIRALADLGAGAALVSGGELKRALVAGVPGERIVFSGVGKTRAEMAAALDAGILQFNVESEPELAVLDEVARGRGTNAPVAIRINPDIDAGTHAKITTGTAENKFGIEWTRAHEVYRRAAEFPNLRVVGVSCHIGSQMTDLDPFRAAFVRLRDLVAMLRADGHPIRNLDLGGGLGIPYGEGPAPGPAAYAGVVREVMGAVDGRFIFEPGRMIVGNAGVLVARVLYVKEGATRTFVVVDAAMNDLLRPALYGAFHAVVPAAEPPAGTNLREVDVVGPVCETGDTFATRRPLPPVGAGDLVAFRTAGAYGATMSSCYNSRPLVPEVMVDGPRFAVVRARLGVDDILARETVPDWLMSRE
jgi:diaminopimelate decarboxylase